MHEIYLLAFEAAVTNMAKARFEPAIWMLYRKLPFWEVCHGRRGCLRLAAYKRLSSHFCRFSSSLSSLDLVSSLNAPSEISLSIGRNIKLDLFIFISFQLTG